MGMKHRFLTLISTTPMLLVPSLAIVACDEERETVGPDFQTAAEFHDHDHPAGEVYTCSMHPEIRSDKPGKCPICGMNLTKLELEDPSDEADQSSESSEASPLWQCKEFPDVTSEVEDVCPIDGSPMIKVDQGGTSSDPSLAVAQVKLRKSQLKHFDPSYFPVSRMALSKVVRALGEVVESEEQESTVPARIRGRVEKVHISTTGALVRKGDPVVDLYSPELVTAGEEYILARSSYEATGQEDFQELMKSSEERLRLWGIRRSQYSSWFQKKSVPRTIRIFSKSGGVVRKLNAAVGKYFKEGENLLELSDLSKVWIEIDIYEHDAGLVKTGQTVQLEFSALPGRQLQGVIDFISPVVDPKSRTLKARATLDNSSGELLPGMAADATLRVNFSGESLVVPRSALIDTGERQVVWQKKAKRNYQASLVRTGRESGGYVEILEGLSEGDQVVTEGSFLLDAQAQLFGGYADFESGLHTHDEGSEETNSDPHRHH